MNQEGLDGLLITSEADITYLTGYLSRDSWLLLTRKGNFYLTDSRYTSEAKKHLNNKLYQIKDTKNSPANLLSRIVVLLRINKIGFNEKHLSLYLFNTLAKSLAAKCRLIPIKDVLLTLRQIKTKEEIAKIRKATQICVKTMQFIQGHIQPGKKEIEIAAEIERYIRYEGGSGSSFDIIVASGENSSFTHHLTSRRIIKENEPVLIDMGVDYLGYKSDLTRVFFLGKISALAKRIYSIVRQAQAKAIAKIKPGVSFAEVDSAARNYIARKGYGKCFAHSLGHGVGLEIHELPRLSPKEKGVFQPGMVVTVEPAVYLNNKFGIRLEDMVLVTKKGCEVLSGALHK